MKTIETYLILCLFTFCACGNSKASGQKEATDVTKDTITTFTLPPMPPMLTTTDQRADYLTKHYWDHFNFADTNYIHHSAITEQAWVDYIDILQIVPLEKAQPAIKELLTKAQKEKKLFTYFTDIAEKYLYDPNSPMKNEEFFIPVLEVMVNSPVLDEVEKIRPQGRLELAQKNRLGTKAIDFTYTLASGAQGRLYQVSSEYTMIFINNPGCHTCLETIGQLRQAPTFNRLLRENRLKVVGIYPDQELDEWRKHQPDFPKEWLNGYDKSRTLSEKNLYDLRAIPSLYLLDRNKTVLLKDAPAAAIEEYLTAHSR